MITVNKDYFINLIEEYKIKQRKVMYRILWGVILGIVLSLLCFVLSQTIKEMIRGFQSKYLTIGKGECGLIEAPFPHFLLSGEGQPRLMQHLHFAGLVPG